MNGDGLGDLVLGTYAADNNGTSSGSAWVINGPIHNAAPITAYESNDTSVSPSSPGTEDAPAVLYRGADDDAYRWQTNLSSTDGGYNSQVFKFEAEFDYTLFNSPTFTVSWNGYGEASQTIYLYLWNFTSSQWEEVDSGTYTSDGDLSGSKTGTDYVSNNIVWVWVKAMHVTGGSGVFTDQVAVAVPEKLWLWFALAPILPLVIKRRRNSLTRLDLIN